MFAPWHGKESTHLDTARRLACLTAVTGLLASGMASAQWLGLLADAHGDRIRVFDATTDAVAWHSTTEPGNVLGDCAVSSDQRTGIATNSAGTLSVLDLVPGPDAAARGTPVAISNLGVDMALSPDNRWLVSAGGGALDQPLSVVSLQTRTEIATPALFTDHTSVEFCDDGTLLVTTTQGEYFNAPDGRALFDARLLADGQVRLLGGRIASGAAPNNAACAPGSKAGVLLDRSGGLTSFTLPGLLPADQVRVGGAEVISASFSTDGRRLYVRTSHSVEAFDFDPLSGELEPDWSREAPRSSPFYGMDQIAVHPAGRKLYVDGGAELLILNAANGARYGAIDAGDATGVCFARVAGAGPVIAALDGAGDAPVTAPP